MVAIFLYMRKNKYALHEVMAFPILILFIVQNVQINYYNVRLLLILWHCYDIGCLRNKVGLSLLFLIEAVAQWTKIQGFIRYTTTASTSIGLSIYFALMIVLLSLSIVQPSVQEK